MANNFFVQYPPGGAASPNASVGPTGTTAPTSATEIGYVDGSGNLQAVSPTNPLPITAVVTGTSDVNLTQVGGSAISEGQKTMAASLPVVIASDQSAVPVSGTVAVTGVATAANQTNGNQKSQIVNSADVSVDAKALNVQVTGTDVGIVTNSIIHGLSTAGGGTYVDVKVNPSGTLTVDASGSTGLVLGAGSAIVGKFGIDQTTPGTTNAVSVTNFPGTQPVSGTVTVQQATGTNLHMVLDSGTLTSITNALPAGTNVIGHVINDASSAIIGKVGIDQTTPGTTNGVQVNAALPAGTNLIGKTGIDQTTPGTTNAVSVAQIGANTVLTGNGVTGTGSQRVTIASDNTAFSVNANTVPSSTSTNATSSSDSSALVASQVIKASAGRLFTLSGVNTKASAQYIQVFNSTTVPVDGTAPVLLAFVSAGANFSWSFYDIGKYFSTGISVCNSSTAATKTIGSADCWFNAEYL